MNQPTATVEAKYGNQTLTANYWMKHDKDGKLLHDTSRASLTLHDLAKTKFPLIFSVDVTPDQASAAIKIFEETGITIHPSINV